MSKQLVLMRDVISKFHRDFVREPALVKFGLKHPEMFDIEKLVEHTVAHASSGALEFIDGSHMDYQDGSDCKTASIRLNSKPRDGKPSNSYPGEISGVSNSAGNNKIGALRCIIYNPHEDEVMFYYLPRSFWKDKITLHPTSGVGKITYNYNSNTKSIARFEGYRLYSFRDLAHATG